MYLVVMATVFSNLYVYMRRLLTNILICFIKRQRFMHTIMHCQYIHYKQAIHTLYARATLLWQCSAVCNTANIAKSNWCNSYTESPSQYYSVGSSNVTMVLNKNHSLVKVISIIHLIISQTFITC